MNPNSSFPVTPDNFLIYVALVCAFVACVLHLIRAVARYGDSHESGIGNMARILAYISAASVTGALLYLLQCILSGARYDIAYVSQHSSVYDEMMYRVSSLWAGQEGSLLFWAVLTALTGLLLMRGLDRVAPALMSFWCSFQAALLVLLIIQDPFRKLVEFQSGSMGSGMNPLLKNPWMVIHPPVVFVAYALLIVPAALALQALVDADFSRWVKRCLPWALAGWVAMTAGLVLGMIWSYEVLGWGGYWGWDPVENASLVPWLFSTALVHGLVLQRQRGRMVRWNIILALLTFLSVLYATYLTRSGIASQAVSVHSFAGDEGFRETPFYQILKWIPIGYASLAAGTLIARWNRMRTSGKLARVDSRDTAIAVGIVVVLLLAVVVLAGTTYTIFSRKSNLDPIFYTIMSIPLATVAVLLISLSPLVAWGGGAVERGSRTVHLIVAALAVAAGISAVLSAGSAKISTTAAVLLLACAVAAVVSGLIAGWRTSLRRCGAYVAHVGVAVMIIGIVLSGSGKQAVVDLTQGGPAAEALDYSLEYIGRERVSMDTEEVRVRAERNGKRFDIGLPVVASSLFRPYVRSDIVGDLYVSTDKLLGTVVTPTMTMGDAGWVAHPWAIPDSQSKLALLGMQVEQHMALLQYERPGMNPVQFEVSEEEPATVDGYTFTFRGYTSSGEKHMMKMTAGVNLGVEGHGHRDVAIIRVTTKPFIWILWLGTLLIMLGGLLALWRRRTENA